MCHPADFDLTPRLLQAIYSYNINSCRSTITQFKMSYKYNSISTPKGVRSFFIFPYDFRGGDDLVLHHVKTCNKNLDTWMANEVARYKESGTKLPITNFIKSAVKERLLMNSEFIQAGKAYLQSASSYNCVLLSKY